MAHVVHVVRRETIPSIHEVMVDGKMHTLGILKDFRKHEVLAGALPKDSRVSMSWVHLDPGQQLDPHVHPVSSMIIVTEGNVHTLGEVEADLRAGDILVVPSGHAHGFRGAGPAGFWGISLQFEARSLYEEPDKAQVHFLDEAAPKSLRFSDATEMSAQNDPVAQLMHRNETYAAEYRKNAIFKLVTDGILTNEKSWNRFLDVFQVWSDAFQKMVLARAIFCDNSRFGAVAQQHMEEEFGHNTALASGRAVSPVWDPVLDACCNWFIHKMMTLDNPEKTVLVHLVIETSSLVFYELYAPLMKAKREVGKKHFDLHASENTQQIDVDHVKMGVELLNQFPLRDSQRLLQIQKQGWQMINTMEARIADLVIGR